jgi:thioesterase domain-containing protein
MTLNSGPLVAIQTEGARPALFCVHGIGGTILNYGHLARCLPEDQPVYGLQARGIDGEEAPFTRIQDMAAEYIRQIRVVQAEGPYYLSGYSFGGLVAFEMACRLEAEGQIVAQLLLLDSSPHEVLRMSPEARYRQATTRQMRRVLLHGGALLRLSSTERREYLRREWRTLRRKLGNRAWQLRYKAYEKLGQPVPRAYLDVKQAGYLAVRQYVPGRFSGTAVLFRAEHHPAIFDDDPALGWNSLVEGGVEVRVVPGEHNTIAVGANAEVLAREVMAAIERSRTARERESSVAGADPLWRRD